MILSIGMIVKNEGKNLRRCLNCLKPILEQVHSELIIADTGSTDDTAVIAKEFTDKVFQIEWRGDFAWARNQTLERARGKWFMFVDADEFFQDPTELIEFFNSGEYKNYVSADHQMEMVTDEKGENTISRPGRLFKIQKDTRFKGKIHEYVTQYPPTKRLNCVSVHEGYSYGGSINAKRRKHERNLAPLLEEYEKNPTDKRTLSHLVNQYFNMKEDWSKVKETLDKALALYENGGKQDSFFHVFSNRLVVYYSHTEQYEKTVAAARDYFSKTKEINASAIDTQMVEAKALMALKRYGESAAAIIKALSYLEMHEKGLLNDDVQGKLHLMGTSPKARGIITDELIKAYSSAGDFANAKLWESKSEGKGVDIFRTYIAAIMNEGRFEDVAVLYNYLADALTQDPKEYEKGISAIESAITNAQTKKTVAAALTSGRISNNGESDYIRLQCLRKQYGDGEMGLEESLNYFISAKRVFSQRYSDVIAAAMKLNADFDSFLENMEIYNMDAMAAEFVQTNSGINEVFANFITNSGWLGKSRSLKCARIMRSFANALLLACPKKDKDILALLFEAFVRTSHKYLKTVYREEIYGNDADDALPETDRFVFYAYKAYERRDAGDIMGFVSGLRTALKKDPGMKEYVSAVKDGLETKKADYDAFSARSQLDREIAAMKDVIYSLIKNGDAKKAGQILAAYSQINPSDPELNTIRDMISAEDSGKDVGGD